MNNSYKIKDALFLGFLLILVIWISPFILIGAGIYCIYVLRKMIRRKKLLKQIEEEWFPKGTYIFFLYSNSKRWKEYFEKEIVSKIQDKASIWNWSTRQKDGWNKDSIEAKILQLYRPFGYFYPLAIVFLPSGRIKTFQFYASYMNMIKLRKSDYKKLEKEFLELADSLKKSA